MEWSVHLVFAGNCEEAFRFYERVLGGKIVGMLAYSASPAAAEVPAEWREKIVHATVLIGGKQLSGADVVPEQYVAPQGFFLLIDAAGAAEAERTFAALAEGGAVRMPLQKTFWSPAFGVVVDRYGVPWEIERFAGASGKVTRVGTRLPVGRRGVVFHHHRVVAKVSLHLAEAHARPTSLAAPRSAATAMRAPRMGRPLRRRTGWRHSDTPRWVVAATLPVSRPAWRRPHRRRGSALRT